MTVRPVLMTAVFFLFSFLPCWGATRTWSGSTGTWDDSNGTPWGGTAPTTGDVVNLTQVTASDITITYDGNQTIGLTGTETNTGTRYGDCTLANSGGGTTTLAIAAGDVLPCNNAYINTGGRLSMSGGLYSPESHMYMNGGSVVQTGGLIEPNNYDLNFSAGDFVLDGGTNRFRQAMIGRGEYGAPYGNAVLRVNGGAFIITLSGGGQRFFFGAPTNTSFATVIQTAGLVDCRSESRFEAGALYRLEGGVFKTVHATMSGGTFIQTNNVVSSNQYDWMIGKNVGESAIYRFCGGTFIARGLYLGSSGGTGEFVQAGGTLASWATTVSQTIGGTNGSGTYLLGDANGPATNAVNGGTQTIVINPTGTFRGHGLLLGPYWQNLYVSGRVIADGYGVESELDLANAADQRFRSTAADGRFVINTYDNPANGSNGWFAVNKGRLKPPLLGSTAPWYVKSANGTTFNWCESVYGDDSEIDLINSAQFVFTGLGTGNGIVTGYLLATGRTDVAAAPLRRLPLSVHDFSLAGNTFTNHTLTIRYDTAAIAAIRGVREESVQIWQYVAAAWAPVTSSMDLAKKLVRTTSLTTLGKFMVTIDAPASGTIIMLK